MIFGLALVVMQVVHPPSFRKKCRFHLIESTLQLEFDGQVAYMETNP